MRLQHKTAIVTGGSTGIGKSIALLMAKDGANVVVDYHGESQRADEIIEQVENFGGKALAVPADVSDPQDVQGLIDQAVNTFGGIDVLVNNAGLEEKHPFLEMPFETYEKVLKVDLTGVWLCSQSAAKQMVKAKRGGRIINISSIHEDVAMPTNAPYCAAKGGVRMLMRTIAVELAEYDITVNNVAPGAIDTPMDAPLKRDPQEMEALLCEIPLKRMGKPDEIAEMCIFLASDAGSYITGSTFFIDGGMSKKSGSL
ncbi:MAG: SDR family oxidoreductase [Candidatus Eremiobacteraeota bacterium]|nr:SDR family oxidoreductase [Candidatus Eremiobacteraeota bacterium]